MFVPLAPAVRLLNEYVDAYVDEYEFANELGSGNAASLLILTRVSPVVVSFVIILLLFAFKIVLLFVDSRVLVPIFQPPTKPSVTLNLPTPPLKPKKIPGFPNPSVVCPIEINGFAHVGYPAFNLIFGVTPSLPILIVLLENISFAKSTSVATELNVAPNDSQYVEYVPSIGLVVLSAGVSDN